MGLELWGRDPVTPTSSSLHTPPPPGPRWSRAPFRPDSLCESQGEEAERDQDEVRACFLLTCPFPCRSEACPHPALSPISITCRLLLLPPTSISSPDRQPPLSPWLVSHTPSWSVSPHGFLLFSCDPQGRSYAFPGTGRTGGRLISRSPGSSSGTDWAAEEAGTAHPSPGLARLGRRQR